MTIAGINLKMYMSVERTREWITAVAHLETSAERFVLPSAVCLADAQRILGPAGIDYGAQDVSAADSGPYTGEISAGMLGELGCRYALIGHAERRARYGEDDATVAAKTQRLTEAGVVPIVCIGEPGEHDGLASARTQLEAVLAVVPERAELVFAYEPVWAIGAPTPPSPDFIAEMARGLRSAFTDRPGRTRLIYGGSAGPGLWTALDGSLDGLFLGRFAHNIDSFAAVLAEMDAAPAPDRPSPATVTP